MKYSLLAFFLFITTCSFFPSEAQTACAPKDGLVAYYPFDETSGWPLDASGHLAAAQWNGSDNYLQPGSGHDGRGAIATTRSVYISIPLTWHPTAYSISFWIKPAARFDWSQFTGADWGTFTFHSTATGAIYVGTDVPTRIYLPNENLVQIGVWQHFVFTFDNGLGTLYKNGRFLASQAGMTLPNEWPGLYFGNSDGLYDDLSIYSRAVTAQEVRNLYSCAPTTVAETNCIDATDLQVRLPLQESTGTLAHDLSGQGNDGVVSGGAWQATNATGSRSLSLSGNDQLFAPFACRPVTFSVAFWANPAQLKDWSSLVAAKLTNNNLWGGFVFHTAADGKIYTGTKDLDASHWIILPAGTMKAKEWQHYVFTYSNGLGTIYKNGVFQASSNNMPLPEAWQGLLVGGTSVYDRCPYEGSISDLRLYLRELTVPEVAALAQCAPQAKLSPPVATTDCIDATGLKVRLPLEEATGTQAHDVSRQGYNGVVSGGVWQSTHSTRPHSLLLENTDNLFVPIACQPDVFTVAFWARPSQLSDWNCFVGARLANNRSSDPWGGFAFHTTADGIIAVGTEYEAHSPTGRIITKPGTLTQGEWQHFVFAYDKGTGTLYRNGVFIASLAGMPLPQAWQGLTVGGFDSKVTFKGNISDLRLYLRALSASEAATLAQCTSQTPSSPPVASTVPCAGLVLNPLSSATIPAGGQTTLRAQAQQASPALAFDGIDDMVENTAVLTAVTNNFTMEAWVNPTAEITLHPQQTSGYDGEFGQRYLIFPTGGWNFGSDNYAGAGISVGTNGVSVVEHSGGYIPPLLTWKGEVKGWTHIAVVYQDRRPTLYINGELKAVGEQSPKFEVHPSLGFGGGIYGYYKWQADEGRIWNTVRSASQLQQASAAPIPATTAGLVGYWRLDEGQGNVVADAISAANTGKLTRGVYTSNGNWQNPSPPPTTDGPQWGNASPVPLFHPATAALQFDGVADQVAITNNGNPVPALLSNLVNTFTMEAWVNPTAPHEIDQQQTGGKDGVYNQRYLIFPTGGWNFGSNDHAGAGISVGTNGVSVYEHAGDYMPALLVWKGEVKGWTHIAVVYQDRRPSLYVNGELVATGEQSPRAYVHPSLTLGGDTYGYFQGQADEIRLWNEARTGKQIQAYYKQALTSPSPGLVGCWNLEEGIGLTTVDASSNNLTGTLQRGSIIDAGRNVIAPPPGPGPQWQAPSTAPLTSDITYSWSPSTGLNQTTGPEVTASPKTTTTYTVTANGPGSCAPVSKQVTVTVLRSSPGHSAMSRNAIVVIPRSIWGQSDKQTVTFPHQSCGNLASLRVEVGLDSGPDHAAAADAGFTTTQQVTVTVSSTGGNVPAATFTSNLNISDNQPEQRRLLDVSRFLGANSATRDLTIEISAPSLPTITGVDPKTQRIVVRCLPQYQTYTPTSVAVTPAAVTPVPGYEQKLQWTSDCALVNSYQLQVLFRPVKVGRTSPELTSTIADYNPSTPPKDESEWNQGGSLLETGSPELFYKLTLAEGEGTYHWRVRAIGSQPGGIANPENWGLWSKQDVSFAVTAPDAASNWIYSRSFSEGGHVAEKLTFANGLQQVRQLQTRLATPTQDATQLGEQVVATQTLQDFAGRDALTSLPIPLPENTTGADNTKLAAKSLGFRAALLARTPGIPYEAADFDQTDDKATDNTAREPRPALEQGYYTSSNDRVADAEGYPFTRTLFSPDGTNRVVEQGGVGRELRIRPTNVHTVRTSYASVAPEEIIRLFGREAPQQDGLYKVITTDPNGISSVTYQAKDGKTVATALSGGDPKNLDTPLQSLPSARTIPLRKL